MLGPRGWRANRRQLPSGWEQFTSIALDTQAGNPNLESESATTWTGGVVFRAPWDSPLINRLAATVDWYRVKIANAISGLTSSSVYEQCLNGTGSNPTYDPNNTFCKLINRDNLFGFPAGVDGVYTNIGAIQTSGIDLQLNWSANLNDLGIPAPGALSLDVAVNHLDSYEIQNSSGGRRSSSTQGTTGNGTTRLAVQEQVLHHAGYAVGPVSTRLELAASAGAIEHRAGRFAQRKARRARSLPRSGRSPMVHGARGRREPDECRCREIVGRIPGVNNAYGQTDPGYYDVLGRR